jgi:hypothetical protein
MGAVERIERVSKLAVVVGNLGFSLGLVALIVCEVGR